MIQSNSGNAYAANGSTCSFSSGLHLFKQLLANKLFLLLFVRTLEQQKDFGTAMKVHFASLLSIVLHSRMDYFTEYDHSFIMAALCNRGGHYIFALWFLYIFYLVLSFFFFLT